MLIDILSLFPAYFKGPFDVSMIGRAIERGLVQINLIDIRNFSQNRHKKVDDRPFGGGPGMVMSPEPVAGAIRSVKKEGSHVIYLSPQGKSLNAAKCKELAKHSHLILLCGHYEGVDERVVEKEVDEEISIGDYVLTNGCAAAIVLVDAVLRFVSGFIGHPEAAKNDSFEETGMFDAPHFTRPVLFEGMEVPEVLRQGDHKEIEKWRQAQARMKTVRVRPELVKGEKS